MIETPLFVFYVAELGIASLFGSLLVNYVDKKTN